MNVLAHYDIVEWQNATILTHNNIVERQNGNVFVHDDIVEWQDWNPSTHKDIIVQQHETIPMQNEIVLRQKVLSKPTSIVSSSNEAPACRQAGIENYSSLISIRPTDYSM